MFVVFACHCALIFVLVETSKTRRALSASPAPMVLLFLPPAVAPRAQKDTSRRSTSRKIKPKPLVTELTVTPSVAAPRNQQSSAATIDWATEAQTVAAAIASRPEASDRHRGSDAPRPPISIFSEPPAHHAGEEFTTSSGEHAVFVSENCYQVASTKSPNAIDNGMGSQTYCIGKSKKPRGDLFDQLPAYEKYHPN
jgi:hypothetical protein